VGELIFTETLIICEFFWGFFFFGRKQLPIRNFPYGRRANYYYYYYEISLGLIPNVVGCRKKTNRIRVNSGCMMLQRPSEQGSKPASELSGPTLGTLSTKTWLSIESRNLEGLGSRVRRRRRTKKKKVNCVWRNIWRFLSKRRWPNVFDGPFLTECVFPVSLIGSDTRKVLPSLARHSRKLPQSSLTSVTLYLFIYLFVCFSKTILSFFGIFFFFWENYGIFNFFS
jgi:hypothetical protein